MGRSELGHCRHRFFHQAAQLGAKGLVVHFGGQFSQRGFITPKADFLDVELIGDDVRQGADQVEDGVIAADHVQSGQRLAHLEVEIGAQLAGEAHDFLHLRHLVFERFIAGEAAGEGEVAEVDGFRHAGGTQVTVNFFGDERSERRGNLAQA